MQLPTTYEELVTCANKKQLYNALIHQLNKYLALSNIDLEFDIEVLPSSLKYVLHETIFNLIQNRFDVYLNLLYIIDVSEAKVKQIESIDCVQIADEVAFLIVQREWQKVWFKNHYA